MRYLFLILLVFSPISYSQNWVFGGGGDVSYWTWEVDSCDEGWGIFISQQSSFDINNALHIKHEKTQCDVTDTTYLISYLIYALDAPQCPDGQEIIYPDTECKPIEPDPEPCLGGGTPVNGICPPIGPGDDDNPPTGGGGDDNPPTGGGGDDNPPTGGGDDDNPPTGGGGDDNPPTGGGGDDNPPTGGGGDDNPPTGGGGDDNPPTGGGGFPDFCRDNPDICLYPPDDPACYDNPALCDVPENEDLLATIRQVTEAVKEQHYNTNTEIKTSTLNTANNTNDLLTAAKANHDQLNKIASNTYSIANNTSDANALLKKNTANIVGAIKDIKSKDYKGQFSVLKSRLDSILQEMRKGFCDKNPEHVSCITELKGNAYSEVFDSSDFNSLHTDIEKVKKEITAKINSFKGILGTPQISSGGRITPVEFSLNHQGQSIAVKQDGFNQVGEMSKAIVIAICSVLALMIVVRT